MMPAGRPGVTDTVNRFDAATRRTLGAPSVRTTHERASRHEGLELAACRSIFLGGRATARLVSHGVSRMPNASRSNSAAQPEVSKDPMLAVRARADALYRGAIECCRQHDRSAKLSDTEEPDLEHRHLDELCKMCDGSLAELVAAYTEAAAHVHPNEDEAWWHKANSLWHASREYQRRHATCDDLARSLSNKRSAEKLKAMQMEYELEASALLALRHASAAYHKTRPGLT